jgi:hypothetical protein
VNAIRVESGDHASCETSSPPSVSLRASPPSDGITYSCCGALPPSCPSRLEVNASHFPSGDQRGAASLRSPQVSRRGGAPPSGAGPASAADQIAPRYEFSSSSTHHTW